MGNPRELLPVAWRWYQKTWLQWLLAALIFLSFSWLYMGPALTSCTTFTASFNSDSSGGIGWFQWASGNRLTWNRTDKSNFPDGESLHRPQFITSEAFATPYRFLSFLTTPICGLNLMVLLGYLSTALLMFGFIRWLFRRNAIALFAGYAAAFAPYHQLKSSSHIIYVFSAVFIAMVWAFMWYVQKPSFRRILPLAALTALAVYTDGYYILLAGLLAVGLLGSLALRGTVSLAKNKRAKAAQVWLNYGRFWANIKTHWRAAAVFGIATICLLIPVAYTQAKHSQEIKNSLSAARGNIHLEAETYGARPLEFLMPATNNPLLPSRYTNWRLNHQHESNTSETTMYLGITVAVLGVVALVYVARYKAMRKLVLRENITFAFVALLFLGVGLWCMAFSMPAHLTTFGVRIPTPTLILIHFTANWRVLSRLFSVIDPLFVMLAAAGLFALVRKRSARVYLAVVGACFAILFLEFLPSPLRSGADVFKDSPPVYHKLAADSQVQEIAEYPILDLLYTPSVFTFQEVHGKKVMNANDSALDRRPLNQGVAGIADPQTLGVLKGLGIDVVTSYGTDFSGIHGLTSYMAVPNNTTRSGVPPVYAYTIDSGVTPRTVAVVPQSGFDIAGIDERNVSHHTLPNNASLRLIKVTPGAADGQYQVEFDVQAISPGPTTLTLSQGGQTLWSGEVPREPIHVSFTANASQDIIIASTNPLDITNMQAQAL